MASALLLVGDGEADESSITSLLEADADRPLQPAPAEGLILWDTDCGIVWTPVTVEGQSGAFIDHLKRHHAIMEKMCRVLKHGKDLNP
jgi:tRNA pseudouridine38-40 synthase